jgi:DNA-binding LacI/PurR family transcriptional regulator
VTTTDVIALGVLDALATRGLVAGRDVSVVGFDDIPEATAANLTTIRQPALEKGRIASARQQRCAAPPTGSTRARVGPRDARPDPSGPVPHQVRG